ncbi:MAG: rhomboid family intramembrane serine protease [Galactobacillus timonensis]|uniref:rhomboid family intramembrane serine protease n=1 Tax=Galactobacillus timonensis TaxID=2041840 RepID=UPI00240A79F1|nr:rhomboid family intramembrane serine protease [Galactobacillus timonensis]MDD5852231.1 rhomboid family intramembrane serine protease [Galactobacillus timonensis]MDD6600347.1 rhomboid family intramembrane serine protease [Galactobacillus timonensis]
MKMPWVSILCIALSIGNYIRMSRSHESGFSAAVDAGALYPPAVRQGQWWRLFSAGFVHFSLWHLLMNCYAMYSFGRGLERILPWPWYLILVVASLVSANFFAMTMGNENSISGGMSGILYGLMGFYYAVFDVRTRGLAGILTDRSMFATLGINLVMNFMPGICWQAHLGGFSAGIVCAFLFLYL